MHRTRRHRTPPSSRPASPRPNQSRSVECLHERASHNCIVGSVGLDGIAHAVTTTTPASFSCSVIALRRQRLASIVDRSPRSSIISCLRALDVGATCSSTRLCAAQRSIQRGTVSRSLATSTIDAESFASLDALLTATRAEGAAFGPAVAIKCDTSCRARADRPVRTAMERWWPLGRFQFERLNVVRPGRKIPRTPAQYWADLNFSAVEGPVRPDQGLLLYCTNPWNDPQRKHTIPCDIT